MGTVTNAIKGYFDIGCGLCLGARSAFRHAVWPWKKDGRFNDVMNAYAGASAWLDENLVSSLQHYQNEPAFIMRWNMVSCDLFKDGKTPRLSEIFRAHAEGIEKYIKEVVIAQEEKLSREQADGGTSCQVRKTNVRISRNRMAAFSLQWRSAELKALAERVEKLPPEIERGLWESYASKLRAARLVPDNV